MVLVARVGPRSFQYVCALEPYPKPAVARVVCGLPLVSQIPTAARGGAVCAANARKAAVEAQLAGAPAACAELRQRGLEVAAAVQALHAALVAVFVAG